MKKIFKIIGLIGIIGMGLSELYYVKIKPFLDLHKDDKEEEQEAHDRASHSENEHFEEAKEVR